MLVLVFLIATVAFGVVRLGLASTATVLALLDWATLGVDVVQFAIIVSAAAHSVTLDTGRASPFCAVDDRHSAAVTAECGRRRWLAAAEREECEQPTGGKERNEAEGRHTGPCAPSDKDTGKKGSMESMLNQTPEGILVNGYAGRGP